MSSDEKMPPKLSDEIQQNDQRTDQPEESCTPEGEGPMKRRSVRLITGGTQFAQTMRLCTASDLGQVIKPFVCLEHEQLDPHERPPGRPRPFSGMAVLTIVLSGAALFEDTTGNGGFLAAGGTAWLMSGAGAWQTCGPQSKEVTRLFRVGMALPPPDENLPARSQYISPSEVPQAGCVRVVLGQRGAVAGVLRVPTDVTVLHVRLDDGQRWHYTPPPGHGITWIAVDRGRLQAQRGPSCTSIHQGELAVFEDAIGMLGVRSQGITSFILGSAKPHPYPVVFDRFSAHTTMDAMSSAKREIARLGRDLLAHGRIP